ncbi:CoxG family protein [Sulfobacillus thermosulfidooxidans]|uniref:CoxG family protein n=1 Tax=Sulfobacillus thermosulfidooxidans TaxID=28034 RepID=UPI0006B46D4B|nr:carbon monoxide dehydrogenase subunit G [Sulfobacillus thermosulfidooxidans]
MKTYQGVVVMDAPRNVVWDFVQDPDAIGRCMPDVIEYEVLDERHLHAKVRVGVGPIRAVFDMNAKIELLPEPYKACLDAQGGGMGSGFHLLSTMHIAQEQDHVSLNWVAEVSVSGPLATLGGRLLDNQVKKITEQVFENIRQGIAAQLAE